MSPIFLTIDASNRLQLATTIERLINLLDDIDGDENLEPDLAGFDERTMDDREGSDERECDLADAHTDLEDDPADGCEAGFIWGGNEGVSA